MTTKEQERKVLAQIKKLVDGLGEGSYIGTAFEGCWEIAEQNIENDWACSMKDRAETAERKLNALELRYKQDTEHLRAVNEHLEKSRDEAQAKAAGNFQEALKHAERERGLEAEISQKCDEMVALRSDNSELEELLKQKDLEIIKLKARLFDLMNA